VIPLFLSHEGCATFFACSSDLYCARIAPEFPARHRWGDIRSFRLYWPMGVAGADRTLRTGHGACRTIS
jgi:hypothetical protein